MKNVLIILLLLISNLNLRGQNTDLSTLRGYMASANTNESEAKLFYKHTRNFTEKSTALEQGFKAMSELIMCNHVSNPFTKFSYFKKGKILLEKAITQDLKNIELRFIRYCVQTNAPSIVDYNDKINDDKKILFSYLVNNSEQKKRDEELFQNVKSFLLQSKNCTTAEKNILKEIS